MTAKERLKSIKAIDLEICKYQDEQKNIRATLEGIKSQNLTKERVSESYIHGDKMAEGIAKLEEYQQKINEEILKITKRKRDVLDTINKIENPDYRIILLSRYFNYDKWEEIALSMNYGYRHVHKLHGRALQEFEKRWH